MARSRAKRKILEKLLGAILLTALVVAVVLVAKQRIPKASVITDVRNRATIAACEEGDPITVCDPSQNRYPIQGQSNEVVTQITQPTQTNDACIDLILTTRGENQHNFDDFTVVYKNSTGATLYTITNLDTNSTGRGTIEAALVPNLVNTETYTVEITADGFFPKTTTVTNALSGTCARASLDPGNFNNRGADVADITTIIRIYNNGYDPNIASHRMVSRAFANRPITIPDVIQVIRAYNQHKGGS